MPDIHRRDRTAACLALPAGPRLTIHLQAAQWIVNAQGTVTAQETAQGTAQGAVATATQAARPQHAVAVLIGATSCRPAWLPISCTGTPVHHAAAHPATARYLLHMPSGT